MARKKNPTRRIIIWTAIVFGVFVVLAIVGKMTGIIGGGDDVVEVETVEAELRTITQVVTANGKIQPEIEVEISPDVSGEIIELRVKEGDRVNQGDLLVRIKPDFYSAQVEQAQAGVSQAKANLAQRRADMMRAETEFNRQQDLQKKGVISESDFLTTKTTYEVSRAAMEGASFAVESAEARLREANEQLRKTTIYSPMTGTISKLNIELGERVVGTSQMAGTEMMRVAELEQMELEVDVNENDVVNVSVGDTATVEVDAYPDRVFKGAVTEIANSARITGAGSQEQVTNFPVKVRILDPHNIDVGLVATSGAVGKEEVPLAVAETPVLRPGMSGTVDIFTQTIANAIAIPIQAVTVRDFKALQHDSLVAQADSNVADHRGEDLRKVVFAVLDGKAEIYEVETGISDDTHLEIRSGLKGGELIIIGPYSVVSRTLEPGDLVKVEEEPDRRRPPALAASN